MTRLALPLALFALFAIFLAPPLQACIWDRDTLESETTGVPEAVAVISGRFPRNPPLYYEMRIERISKEIEKEDSQLELYDDIAVALDRVGRGEEAIKWMERKERLLLSGDQSSANVKEHTYRYLANLGTFRAHQWLRRGGDFKDVGDLEQARNLISRAIKLNPKAHFNREIYQLHFLDWVLTRTKQPESAKLNFLSLREVPLASNEDGDQHSEAIRGVSGLIALGNAWESVDVFRVLELLLREEGRSSVAYLARRRWQELLAAGGRSFLGEAVHSLRLDQSLKDTYPLDPEYQYLRWEADRWQRARTNYMLKRLRQGRHPDTDASFWDDFTDYPVGARPFWFMGPVELLQYLLFLSLAFLFPFLVKKVRQSTKKGS